MIDPTPAAPEELPRIALAIAMYHASGCPAQAAWHACAYVKTQLLFDPIYKNHCLMHEVSKELKKRSKADLPWVLASLHRVTGVTPDPELDHDFLWRWAISQVADYLLASPLSPANEPFLTYREYP